MKRILDWVLSVMIIICISPILIFLWIYCRIMSGGSGIFTQKRIGKDEVEFDIYKFRTMYVHLSESIHRSHVEDAIKNGKTFAKVQNDPRIIPFGNFIRKYGLDELPQLFNVIKGNMSLVGPRPCLPFERDLMNNNQRKRFKCIPGITGLWQVNGKNKTTFDQMLDFDIMYVNFNNIILDIKILFRTIFVVMQGSA